MKRLLKDDGFTLIELMVVVAIIGVLSAIAVPNFKKYQAKAKQSEAKIQLAALYSAEVGSLSDYDTYGSCILDLGYEISPKGYYLVGFASANATENAIIVARGAACDDTIFDADIPAAGQQTASGTTFPATGSLAGTNVVTSGAAGAPATFIAGAEGNITSLRLDMWTINESKSLVNTQIGY
jgi:type IV pilus assembly protein PilA